MWYEIYFYSFLNFKQNYNVNGILEVDMENILFIKCF